MKLTIDQVAICEMKRGRREITPNFNAVALSFIEHFIVCQLFVLVLQHTTVLNSFSSAKTKL